MQACANPSVKANGNCDDFISGLYGQISVVGGHVEGMGADEGGLSMQHYPCVESLVRNEGGH